MLKLRNSQIAGKIALLGVLISIFAFTATADAYTFDDAINELYAGNYAKAREICKALSDSEKQKAEYHLIYALTFIGSGAESHAPLEKAMSMKGDTPQLNAIVALSFLRKPYLSDKQKEHFRKKAEVFFEKANAAGQNNLLLYVDAISAEMRGKPDIHREKILQKLAKIKKSPLAGPAKECLEELRKYKHEILPKLKKAHEQRKALEKKLKKQEEQLKKTKTEGRKLTEKKNDLQASYDKNRNHLISKRRKTKKFGKIMALNRKIAALEKRVKKEAGTLSKKIKEVTDDVRNQEVDVATTKAELVKIKHELIQLEKIKIFDAKYRTQEASLWLARGLLGLKPIEEKQNRSKMSKNDDSSSDDNPKTPASKPSTGKGGW